MWDEDGMEGGAGPVEGAVVGEGAGGEGVVESHENELRGVDSGGIEPGGIDSCGADDELERAVLKLGAEQQKALSFLVEGKSLVETSRICRITRQTLYRWMKEDAAFVAAYNRWCEQMHQSARSRLLGMADKATVAVERALENGDARAALQLLRGLGVLKEQKAGSGDAEEMKSDLEWGKHRRRMVEEKRRHRVVVDSVTLPLGKRRRGRGNADCGID